jgi:hypothetical protein
VELSIACGMVGSSATTRGGNTTVVPAKGGAPATGRQQQIAPDGRNIKGSNRDVHAA